MKATKSEADYGPGDKAEHCGICRHFDAGVCSKVSGSINPSCWCKYFSKEGSMAELTAAARKKIPGKEFAGPDRSYPINDPEHAANAKARAKQQLDKGRISQAQYDSIVAKANKKLGPAAKARREERGEA